MSLAQVKKELKEYSREQLAELVTDLYQAKNVTAREYLEFMLNPDEEKLYEAVHAEMLKEMNRTKWSRSKMRTTPIKKQLLRFVALGTSIKMQMKLRLQLLYDLVMLSCDYEMTEAQRNYARTLMIETVALADKNQILDSYLEEILHIISPEVQSWYNRSFRSDLRATLRSYDPLHPLKKS